MPKWNKALRAQARDLVASWTYSTDDRQALGDLLELLGLDDIPPGRGAQGHDAQPAGADSRGDSRVQRHVGASGRASRGDTLMGMSTHVYGFHPPDDRWHEMKAAWDACEKAGIDPPEELWAFFGGNIPDPAGVEVDLGDALTEYASDMTEGFEVRLDKLTPDVKILRFVNSY